MGLDSYLTGRRYLSDYVDEEKEAKATIAKMPPFDVGFPIKEVTINIMWWRKANHIHRWFVETVQNGIDDCKEYYVDEETLKALVGVCETVLKDHDKAPGCLPTQSGFFFGGTEYNSFYFRDIEDTVKVLKPLVDDPDKLKGWDLYYRASW